MSGEMEKGSSSSFPSGGDGADSINSLKFGEKFYFAGTVSGARAEEAPPTSPAKKWRAVMTQGGQPPRCQVEGCKADLSDAKAYYCRHKVCGAHSKSPTVIVAGLEQRFCQQCSRFHQLPEFDQGKRSCRRRLAGHNERRRKPQSGPILTSHHGTLSPFTFDKHSGGGGGLVMDFSSYSSNTGAREQGLHPLLNPQPPAGCFDPSALSLLSNTSWTPPQNHFLEPTMYQGMASADMGLAAAFSNNQFSGFAESSSRHYHDEMEEPPLHHMHMDWSL